MCNKVKAILNYAGRCCVQTTATTGSKARNSTEPSLWAKFDPQNYRMPEEIGKNGRKEMGEKAERKVLSIRQIRANAAIQRSRPLPCLTCVFRSHGYKVAVPFLCGMSES